MPLRPATLEDGARLAALGDQAEAAGTLAVGVAATLAAALKTTLAGAADEGVVIFEDDRGEPLGCARFTTHNARSRIAGIHTLVVDPAARGRGHAVNAIGELVRHLIDELGFHRVEAETYASNTAARRAFTRAGFVEEGTRRRAYDRHGGWQDGTMLGYLRDV